MKLQHRFKKYKKKVDVDFVALFSKELDVPFSVWKESKDLMYILECAQKFASDPIAYYDEIHEKIAPRLANKKAAENLNESITAIYEKWQVEGIPVEIIAQAVEVAANDIRLLDQMRQAACDVSVVTELERTLPEDAVQVGERLKRNAFRKILATKAAKKTQVSSSRIVTTLEERCKDLPYQLGKIKQAKNGVVLVIITGGRSTRVRTTIPKGIIYLGGKPMIDYTIEAAKEAGVKDIVVVVGFKKELNQKIIGDNVSYVEQDVILGTGHAVMQAKSLLSDYEGTVMVSYSDMPFITSDTLRQLVESQKREHAVMTILTTTIEKRPEFGRLIYSKEGKITRISQPRIEDIPSNEVDAGFYCFKSPEVWKSLGKTNDDNNRMEYSLTGILEVIAENEETINTLCTHNEEETLGINRPHELIIAERILYCREHLTGKDVVIDHKKINENLYHKGRFYENYGGQSIDDFIPSFPSSKEANEQLESLVTLYDQKLNNTIGAIFWLKGR